MQRSRWTLDAIGATIGRARESLALAAQQVEVLERAGPANDRQIWALRRIRERLDEAAATVRWLETIARADPQQPQIRPLLLDEEVRRAVDRAAAMADLAGATVLVTAGSPARAYADPEILGRVLDNLLDNALTYSEGRPWVVVETGSDPRPFIRVSDAGIGLTPEAAGRIFEPSYRADPDNASRPGSGIGLSFSRHAVEEMGGSLILESTGLGSGSTFRLDLRPA